MTRAASSDAPAGPDAQAGSDAAFSVIVPLWSGDRADRARAALASATLGEHLRPSTLVLAVDGPLPAPLEEVVHEVGAGVFGPALVRRHEAHRGLAPVLQDALVAAPDAIVARADADDLCRPERFALQSPEVASGRADLLGATLQEFSDEVPPGTGPLRHRPLTHEEIVAYLPTHSPFHHPAVMMRREVALAAGGYRELDHLEDYWLWERMILAGARRANRPEVLVDYRVDEALFARRGGWRMLASDVRLRRIFHADRVTTRREMPRNLARRTAYRLVPGTVRRLAYRLLVERRG